MVGFLCITSCTSGRRSKVSMSVERLLSLRCGDNCTMSMIVFRFRFGFCFLGVVIFCVGWISYESSVGVLHGLLHSPSPLIYLCGSGLGSLRCLADLAPLLPLRHGRYHRRCGWLFTPWGGVSTSFATPRHCLSPPPFQDRDRTWEEDPRDVSLHTKPLASPVVSVWES